MRRGKVGRKKCTPGIDRFLHLIFVLKRKTDKPAGKVGFDWKGATEGTPQRKEVGDWSFFFFLFTSVIYQGIENLSETKKGK